MQMQAVRSRWELHFILFGRHVVTHPVTSRVTGMSVAAWQTSIRSVHEAPAARHKKMHHNSCWQKPMTEADLETTQANQVTWCVHMT